MIWGCFFATISVLVMSSNPTLPVYTIAFLILSISNNAIMAPYSGLVPDLVPASQVRYVAIYLSSMFDDYHLYCHLCSMVLFQVIWEVSVCWGTWPVVCCVSSSRLLVCL